MYITGSPEMLHTILRHLCFKCPRLSICHRGLQNVLWLTLFEQLLPASQPHLLLFTCQQLQNPVCTSKALDCIFSLKHMPLCSFYTVAMIMYIFTKFHGNNKTNESYCIHLSFKNTQNYYKHTALKHSTWHNKIHFFFLKSINWFHFRHWVGDCWPWNT